MILLISCFKEYLWCHIKLVTLASLLHLDLIESKNSLKQIAVDRKTQIPVL